MSQRFIDEQVTRGIADHLEHPLVLNTLLAQALDQAVAGALRGHADALDF